MLAGSIYSLTGNAISAAGHPDGLRAGVTAIEAPISAAPICDVVEPSTVGSRLGSVGGVQPLARCAGRRPPSVGAADVIQVSARNSAGRGKAGQSHCAIVVYLQFAQIFDVTTALSYPRLGITVRVRSLFAGEIGQLAAW